MEALSHPDVAMYTIQEVCSHIPFDVKISTPLAIYELNI